MGGLGRAGGVKNDDFRGELPGAPRPPQVSALAGFSLKKNPPEAGFSEDRGRTSTHVQTTVDGEVSTGGVTTFF
jgi:hypothetical protein